MPVRAFGNRLGTFPRSLPGLPGGTLRHRFYREIFHFDATFDLLPWDWR
jgi:hypothetical protein